jgi:phosphinothricin acetyltransferase
MDIRLALSGDLPAINRIYNQAVRQRFCTAHLTPVSMEYREAWFTTHDQDHFPVFVTVSDKKVTGWVSLGAYRPGRHAFAHVAEVSYYVDEKERGKGIGTALMEHAVKEAPHYKFNILIAILLNRNPASIALLEKFDFSQWGSMPGIAKIDGQLADHLYYGLQL